MKAARNHGLLPEKCFVHVFGESVKICLAPEKSRYPGGIKIGLHPGLLSKNYRQSVIDICLCSTEVIESVVEYNDIPIAIYHLALNYFIVLIPYKAIIPWIIPYLFVNLI